MTVSAPTGARPRRGRPRHHDSPRARAHARSAPEKAEHTVEHTAGPTAGAATQLTSVVEVDLTGTSPDAVLHAVAAAAVRAAAAHPSVVRSRGVHLAVLAADGTTTAVVPDADELTAEALAARIAAGQQGVTDRTLCVADTGSRGVLLDTPAVGADRAAVLGIGAVVRRPVVRDTDAGEVVVARSMAYLSLSHDPSLTGADAADFLRSVQTHLDEGTA